MLKLQKLAMDNLANKTFKITSNILPTVSYFDGLPSKQEIKSYVQSEINENGYILLRNTGIRNSNDIVTNNFAYDIFGDQICDYNGTDGRTKKDLSKYPVLDVDSQPKEIFIWFHSEEMYHTTFPKYVMFVCDYPSHTGGFTPIADSYLMYDKLAEKYPDMIERLHNEGITYVRNIPHKSKKAYLQKIGGYKYKSWEASFLVESSNEAEEYLNKHGYEYEWRDFEPFDASNSNINGEENDLRTFINRSPFIKCEKTGRYAFSNCLLGINGHYFDAVDAYKSVGLCDRPYHVLWGNKEELDYDNVVMKILETYYECAMVFAWQPGDIIIVDNLWWQHSRTPYDGERSLSLMMASPLEWKDKQHVKYVNDVDPLE